MILLQPEKSQACDHHGEGNTPYPVVEKIIWGEEFDKEYFTQVNEITFILKGSYRITLPGDKVEEVKEGQIYFLPPETHIRIDTHEEVRLLTFRLHHVFTFCEEFSLTKLKDEVISHRDSFNPLLMNDKIMDYVTSLLSYMEDGICCSHFIEIKLKELFYIFTAYYDKQSLVGLFFPILSEKQKFSDFVMKNYALVKTVKELAELSKYSLSGFEKEFKKVFGIPAYRWMLEKKINRVHHELTTTTKPLKVIADACRFSSVTQLNDFCKKHFGTSPGKMRKKKSK